MGPERILAAVEGWRRAEPGQSLVEMALLLPVLVFGLIGGTDLARAFSAQMAAENASRAGAEAAVLQAAASDSAIITYARNELSGVPGVDPNAATITVTHSTSGGVSYVTVRVVYTWRTLAAWPLVPNTATFDRSTKMRKYS